MLILSRKEEESVQIGEDIEIKIIQTSRGFVKIGIEAPRSVLILRKELIDQVKDANIQAGDADAAELGALSEQLKK